NDKRRLDLDLALAKQPNAVLAAAGQACSLQRSVIDHDLGIELACINELLDETQVHLSVILGENVVEPTLRDPHVQRHLAAFEALDADARARFGTLLAASSSLALAGTNATADTHTALTGTIIVTKIIKFHVLALAFALNRAGTNIPAGAGMR